MRFHKKNISLLNDLDSKQAFSHKRSFSNSKNNINNNDVHFNFISPLYFETQSLYFPMRTQISKQDTPFIKNYKKIQTLPLKKIKQSQSKQKKSLSKKKLSHQGRYKSQGIKYNKTLNKQSQQLKQHKMTIQLNSSGVSPLTTQRRKIVPKKQKKQNPKSQNKSKQQIKKQTNIDESNKSEYFLKKYQQYLTQKQKQEIKQFKWIYYIGKIKQRIHQDQYKQINSARQCYRQDNNDKYYNQITQNQQKIDRQKNKQDHVEQFYKYEIGDHIGYRYEIIQSINQGSFGEVLKVYDHKTKQFLALKIVKKSQQLIQQTLIQISILTQLKQKDKNNLNGIVKIKDFTIFRNHFCLLFELLDGNLYQLIVANNYRGLSQDVIRVFAVQILNSLIFLNKQKIIHCDIKPQNIVMRKWGKSGIKLIDFGTSCYEGKQIYQYIQSRFYRAPQIIFKKKYQYPIDMWSLGCVLAQLKIGQPIFAGSSDLQQILYFTNTLGLPKQSDGQYSKQFLQSKQFKQLIQNNYIGQYRKLLFKGQEVMNHNLFKKFTHIKTCMLSLKQRLCEQEGQGFYNFLLKILVWEPQRRLKPSEALQQQWIIKGLPPGIKQFYTIFNTTQQAVKSKPKSKQSNKSSKNKSSKKSKQLSQGKKQIKSYQLKSKQKGAQIKLKKIIKQIN